MKPILLPSAKPIWDLRLAGKKPKDLIFVSLVGWLNVDNPTIVIPNDVQPERCEWRWVADLAVCLVFDEQVNKKRIWSAVQSIARCVPNGGFMPFSKHLGYLWMWNVTSQIGTLMTWWRGHEAIPDFDIEAMPEMFDAMTISKYDRKSFEGITYA